MYSVSTLLSEEELVCVPPSQITVRLSPHPPILHHVDTASTAFVGKLGSWALCSLKRAVMPKETTSRIFCWVLHSHQFYFIMKEFLKIILSLLPQSFLWKYSDNLSAKGIAHTSALGIITVSLCGSGQYIRFRSTCKKDWKAQEEVKIITWIGLWFCQKILQTTKDECSALSPVAVVTDLPIQVMLRSNSCDYLAQ